MKICDLCIISNSSANEETVMSKIPCMDLISDLRNWERNQFLIDNKTYVRVENNVWRNITFEKFNEIFKKLEIKEKYLFTHNNTSKKIFEFISNRHPDYFK